MVPNAPPVRFLVVEDEALLALDIEMTVEDCGHKVVGGARNLESVSQLPADTDPHIAFVDIQLANETSGLDVSALIKQRWPYAIIVFVTANAKHIPEDFSIGHAVISKPFSLLGMKQAIEYLVEEVCDPPPRFPLPKSLEVKSQLGLY